MSFTIVAAISENNVIGKNEEIPWHISEDLRRFKKLTLNHSVIMGRKTYESIIRRLNYPLKDRKNIVLTRDTSLNGQGIHIAHSIDEAVELAGSDLTYVIGGESIYRSFSTIANFMEITRVHKTVQGDAYFPNVNWNEWNEMNREIRDGYSFHSYERING